MTTEIVHEKQKLPWHSRLVEALSGHDAFASDGWLEFFIDRHNLYVLVSDEEASRLRIRVYLPVDQKDLVAEWVQAQPNPRCGVLELSSIDPGEWRPRLVFERPAGSAGSAGDPMAAEIEAFATAWGQDVAVSPSGPSGSAAISRKPDVDPLATAPANAWLLKGTEPSFPTQAHLNELQRAARLGIYNLSWTVAPQTRRGDLVLLYFLSPRKAVHFVARAAGDAYFSREIQVNADRTVARAQWWAPLTVPVPIDPIPLTTLRDAAAGHLPMRGRSGRYLRPETIASLNFISEHPDLSEVVREPVGRAELPDPASMDLSDWRAVAGGALVLEEEVSRHLVEPLLRLLVDD